MIEKYVESFREQAIACAEAMFGLSLAPEGEASTCEITPGESRTWVLIPFSGPISGDYLIATDDSWAPLIEGMMGDGSEATVNACLKEYLNTVVGEAINAIMADFSDLTFLSPLVLRGSLDMPQVKTYKCRLSGGGVALDLILSLNLMKQDIGLKLEDQVRQTLAEKQRAHKAEATVKAIMGSIPDGILVLDGRGCIRPGFSSELGRLFFLDPREIEEKSFVSICPAGALAGQGALFSDWLKLALDPPCGMPWEDVCAIGPLSLCDFRDPQGARRVYRFAWTALDAGGEKSLLGVIRDVTRQQEMEEAVENAKREHERNMELVSAVISINNADLMQFLGECNSIIGELENALEAGADRDMVNHLFRGIHTLKGNASTMRFRDLSDSAHELEDVLQLCRSGSGFMHVKDETAPRLAKVKGMLNNIHTLLNRFNIRQEARSGCGDQIAVDMNELTDLARRIEDFGRQQSLPQLACFSREIHDLLLVPVSRLRPLLGQTAENLALELGKTVAFVLDDAEIQLRREVFHELSTPLLHMVRNALDHGLECAAERQASGKTAIGRLSIRFETNDEPGEVIVRIEDDGRGIDADRIAALAVKKGLAHQAEVEAMNSGEKLRLILRPGFSSKDEISQVSGRGVGMDVVAQRVEMLGGLLTIDSQPGNGTRFVISIPNAY
ncbi:MAG: hypothetical protein RL095_1579 [Verrucomicrobiota bacterium]|jgi:signal transduction histidine kinase/PAS domain-containing protein